MSLRKDFGQKIQNIRKSLGLSQEQLAELVGLQRKSISLTESGKTFPTPENLEKIATALKMSIPDLFMFNQNVNRATNLSSLNLFASTLDEEEIAYFLACMKAYVKLKRKK